jgi:hypothetical protein
MKIFSKISVLIILISASTIVLQSCKDEEPTPTSTVPSNLTYDPSTVVTDEGVNAESAVPTIDGTTPITYSIVTTPDAGSEITIDVTTGVISATGATSGIYMVTVTATNDAGAAEFKDALTIDVKAKAKITYKANIVGIITNSCAPCHVYGGNETNYGNSFANASGAIDNIINRVNRTQGTAGFMPYGGTKLDAATLAIIDQWKADGALEE